MVAINAIPYITRSLGAQRQMKTGRMYRKLAAYPLGVRLSIAKMADIRMMLRKRICDPLRAILLILNSVKVISLSS
jgi:hypothetical protein